MVLKITNNATTTITAPITSATTTIVVASGTGVLFPTLGTGDYFQATLQDTNNNFELVKVTARTDDTMTVVRGQGGTVAIPFAADSRFEIRVTADNLRDYVESLDFLRL